MSGPTPVERARRVMRGPMACGHVGLCHHARDADALNAVIPDAALDFAEAVEKSLAEDHSAMAWSKCVKALDTFNAAILRALPGGGASTAVKGGRDGDE